MMLGLQPVMTLRSQLIGVQELDGERQRRLRRRLHGDAARIASGLSPAATRTVIRALPRTERRCLVVRQEGAACRARCRWTC